MAVVSLIICQREQLTNPHPPIIFNKYYLPSGHHDHVSNCFNYIQYHLKIGNEQNNHTRKDTHYSEHSTTKTTVQLDRMVYEKLLSLSQMIACVYITRLNVQSFLEEQGLIY